MGKKLAGNLEDEGDLATRWRMLAFLALSLVLAMSTWFSASAVIPQLRNAWDLTPNSAAWLTIAVQVGFVVEAVTSSFFTIADVISPRHVSTAGAIGAAGVNFLLLFANGPEAGIPLRFATGFFLAGVYTPAFKLISTWSRQNRGVALGILAAAIVVGNGFPYLIKGLGGLDWRIVILSPPSKRLLGAWWQNSWSVKGRSSSPPRSLILAKSDWLWLIEASG